MAGELCHRSHWFIVVAQNNQWHRCLKANLDLCIVFKISQSSPAVSLECLNMFEPHRFKKKKRKERKAEDFGLLIFNIAYLSASLILLFTFN